MFNVTNFEKFEKTKQQSRHLHNQGEGIRDYTNISVIESKKMQQSRISTSTKFDYQFSQLNPKILNMSFMKNKLECKDQIPRYLMSQLAPTSMQFGDMITQSYSDTTYSPTMQGSMKNLKFSYLGQQIKENFIVNIQKEQQPAKQLRCGPRINSKSPKKPMAF